MLRFSKSYYGVRLSRFEPDDVPNLPEHTAVAGLAYAGGGSLPWRLDLDLEWVDERSILNPRYASSQARVDGYVLMNGRVALPLERLGLQLPGEAFVALENLSDEEYEHRLGYPMPGRTWTLGVDLPF